LTKKAPYKGLGADSEEKREPVSDIDTVVVDSLKTLDPKRPIREGDKTRCGRFVREVLPAQPVDATQALNFSAGVSNRKVFRGRSLS
jgi:hypothetical protein